MKKIITVVCLLLAMLLTLAACGEGSVVVGSVEQKTPNNYKWSYMMFKRKKSVAEDLYKAETLKIEVEVTEGALGIKIQCGDNEPIYENADVKTGSFTVNIPKDGNYVVTFTSEKTAGSIHIARIPVPPQN